MVFNLLGKLGKTVGLEGEFGKGFVSGAAGRVSKTINDDIERTKENSSRLAQIRFERGVKEKDRYDEDYKQNELEVDALVASLEGNVDAAKYLLQKNNYNIDSAKQELSELLVNKEYNMTVPDIISQVMGIEQNTNGKITSKDLTNRITRGIKISDISDDTEVAMGILNLPIFGGGDKLREQVQKMSDARLDAYGVPTKEQIADTLPDVQGKINPVYANRKSNTGDEIRRLSLLIPRLAAEGKDDLASLALRERDSLAISSRFAQKKLAGTTGFDQAMENDVIRKLKGTANELMDIYEYTVDNQYIGAEGKADKVETVNTEINKMRFIMEKTASASPELFGTNLRRLEQALMTGKGYKVQVTQIINGEVTVSTLSNEDILSSKIVPFMEQPFTQIEVVRDETTNLFKPGDNLYIRDVNNQSPEQNKLQQNLQNNNSVLNTDTNDMINQIVNILEKDNPSEGDVSNAKALIVKLRQRNQNDKADEIENTYAGRLTR